MKNRLILRYGRIGIWDLHNERWHKLPFTENRQEAYEALVRARQAEELPQQCRATPWWRQLVRAAAIGGLALIIVAILGACSSSDGGYQEAVERIHDRYEDARAMCAGNPGCIDRLDRELQLAYRQLDAQAAARAAAWSVAGTYTGMVALNTLQPHVVGQTCYTYGGPWAQCSLNYGY